MAFWKILFAVPVVLLLVPSCRRTTSKEAKSPEELQGVPDILAEVAKPSSPWRAFRLRAFEINHIWGAEGYEPHGDKWANYRAKITLWDEGEDVAVAELFFRDPPQFDPKNPQQNPQPDKPADSNDQSAQDPTKRGRTYRLHFPTSTLDGILNTLRFSNTEVYLFYYDHQWAIGSAAAERIGSN